VGRYHGDRFLYPGDLVAIKPTEDSISGGDTLLSSTLPSDAPGEPRQRLAIEAALFGGAAEQLSVGRFRLLNRLGSGAMGTVYAAYDERLDRKIAVKLIKTSQIDSTNAHERTLREARALARLSHPNVVHVYEVGEIEEQLFVAMECLAGPTLRAWLDAGPYGWQETLAVYRQAGEGLAAAHAQGVIHRDFKPQNAMFGADKRVRVLDFGLARLGESEQASNLASGQHGARVDEALTVTGTVLGTPAYMSPEQFDGTLADARSDQFGFCVALYEALYGQRPYAGRTLQRLIEAVNATKIEEPPSGSNVPGWLRKIVVRGLAKNPDERWPSMRALLAALADDPAMRRRRWAAAALLIGLLGGGAWGLTYAVQRDAQTCEGMDAKLDGVWDDERRAEVETAITATQLSYAADTWERVEQRLDDYTRAWVVARVEACEASRRGEQSGELLDLRMACLDERLQHVRAAVELMTQADETIVNKAVQLVAGLPALERCADMHALTTELAPPEDPEVARRVAALDEQLVEVKALKEAGKDAEGLALVDTVVSEATTLAYEPLLARAWVEQGKLQRRTSDLQRSEATLKQAYEAAVGLGMANEAAAASGALMLVVGLDLARYADGRLWGIDAKSWARAVGTSNLQVAYLEAIGGIATAEAKYDEARGYYEQALGIVETAVKPTSLEPTRALQGLGNLARLEGKYDEAREYVERALASAEQLLGPQHPNLANQLIMLGAISIHRGKLDEARGHFERAFTLATQPRDRANALQNLGIIAAQQQKLGEALTHLKHALTIYEETVGPEHPNVGSILANLGSLSAEAGKYDEAQQYLERALQIGTKARGPEHPEIAGVLGMLADVATLRGNYDEAQQYLERALQIDKKALGADHPNLAITLQYLGSAAEGKQNLDEALEYFEQALAINEKALGPEHPEVAYSLILVGKSLARMKKHDEARDCYERAITILEKSVGPDAPDLVSALTGLADLSLQEGHPEHAVPLFERALTIRSSAQDSPLDLATSRFNLARALWDAPAGRGRDRERALALAERARATYAEASPIELEQVESWLAKRAH
jgi:tetratricopeptide (TPR) repeat protein/tRNA A-37 threonylcarbamoyl transferase component Bud32